MKNLQIIAVILSVCACTDLPKMRDSGYSSSIDQVRISPTGSVSSDIFSLYTPPENIREEFQMKEAVMFKRDSFLGEKNKLPLKDIQKDTDVFLLGLYLFYDEDKPIESLTTSIFIKNCKALGIFNEKQISYILTRLAHIHAKYLMNLKKCQKSTIVQIIQAVELGTKLNLGKKRMVWGGIDEGFEKIKRYMKVDVLPMQNDLKAHIVRIKNAGKPAIDALCQNRWPKLGFILKAVEDETKKMKKSELFAHNVNKKMHLSIIYKYMLLKKTITAEIWCNKTEPSAFLKKILTEEGIKLDGDIYKKIQPENPQTVANAVKKIFICRHIKKANTEPPKDAMENLLKAASSLSSLSSTLEVCNVLVDALAYSFIQDFATDTCQIPSMKRFSTYLMNSYNGMMAVIDAHKILLSISDMHGTGSKSEVSLSACYKKSNSHKALPKWLHKIVKSLGASCKLHIHASMQEPHVEITNVFSEITQVELLSAPVPLELKYMKILSIALKPNCNYIILGVNLHRNYMQDCPRQEKSVPLHVLLFYRALTLFYLDNVVNEQAFSEITYYALQVMSNNTKEQKMFKDFILS
ncbi:uncharacterized protein NEMAJ01_0051 [Nematocida major]|uniref:uncharacterized protein n=1 Tax=Nematocida major TaxID=1912982 RepID=UPI00200729F0|nr:uncharacterized protein NEMAJ01_0051 [Nematocida major]KAH9385155.1 hypothetical protein NEMAJ01_0051 [Nematocida major]